MHLKRYLKLTPNDEYESFVNAQMEAAAECIPTKLNKTKFPGRHKQLRKNVKTASLYNRRNPTNANAQKKLKAQSELTNEYLKEQTKYIQERIDKIRDSVGDRQSKIAWQTVNEVSCRKSTVSSEATSQEERID